MAEPASTTRPVWLAAGITFAVVIVVAAIFGAPSVIDCSISADGFGACMREKLVAARLLPPGAPTVPQTADAPADAEATATPATTSEQAPVSLLSAMPELGLVRAQPDGSLVIAGSAAPGTIVEIYANDMLLGTAQVEGSGDWVLVPDMPLPAGGYEIRVQEQASKTYAERSVVVVINDDKVSEPLVVASTPGEASRVLQGLSEQRTEVAAVEPAAPAIVQEPAQPPAAEPVAPAAATEEQPVVQPAVEAEPEQAQIEPEAEAAEPVAEPAEPAAPEEEPVAVTPEQATEVADAEDVVGDVEALQQQIESLAPVIQPTIDAIEIDGDKNFFAGIGEEGATVRVYVDNLHVGDATVNAGHWLLETSGVLQNRTQRVRADQLAIGSADVIGRAEVDFIFNVPAVEPAPAEQPVAVAEVAPAPAPVTESSQDADSALEVAINVPQPDFAIDTEQPVIVETMSAMETAAASPTEPAVAQTAEPAVTQTAEPAVTQTAEPATIRTAEAAAAQPVQEAAGGVSTGVSGAIEVPTPDFSIDTGIPVIVIPETSQVASTPEPIAVADAPQAEQPSAPTSSEIQLPEPDFAIDTEQPVIIALPEAEEPAVAEVSEPEIPQLVAVPIGDPEAQRFASGKAIIRHGDNLWTIARRVYGSGYEYLQIYRANRSQIRNPDLIYPGQVFDLPQAEGEATK